LVRRPDVEIRKRTKNRVLEKTNFASGFNDESGFQSFAQKYLTSVFRKFVIHSSVPCPREGRFAIVTSVGAGCDGRDRIVGRSDVDADGKVVWSWHPWAGAKFAVTNRERR
jgi:hypothetical protein